MHLNQMREFLLTAGSVVGPKIHDHHTTFVSLNGLHEFGEFDDLGHRSGLILSGQLSYHHYSQGENTSLDHRLPFLELGFAKGQVYGMEWSNSFC